MRRLLLLLWSMPLLMVLGGCAASDGAVEERCTPQWPPGPCAESNRSR